MRRFRNRYEQELPNNLYETIGTRVTMMFKEETIKASKIANMTLSQYIREAIKQFNRLNTGRPIEAGTDDMFISK